MWTNSTPKPCFASKTIYNCKKFITFDPMSDIDEAIVDLFNSDLFNNLCRRYGGNNYEDLKSEVVLVICELPEQKKKQMIENQYLLQYALQIARFQGMGDKRTARGNNFQRKFADPTMIYTDAYTDITDPTPDYQYDFVNDFVEPKLCSRIQQDSQKQTNKLFFHSRLLLETLKYKNVKQAALAIGIPYNSVRQNLNDYKKVLNEWLKSQQS